MCYNVRSHLWVIAVIQWSALEVRRFISFNEYGIVTVSPKGRNNWFLNCSFFVAQWIACPARCLYLKQLFSKVCVSWLSRNFSNLAVRKNKRKKIFSTRDALKWEWYILWHKWNGGLHGTKCNFCWFFLQPFLPLLLGLSFWRLFSYTCTWPCFSKRQVQVQNCMAALQICAYSFAELGKLFLCEKRADLLKLIWFFSFKWWTKKKDRRPFCGKKLYSKQKMAVRVIRHSSAVSGYYSLNKDEVLILKKRKMEMKET